MNNLKHLKTFENFSDVSKSVGWEQRTIDYPTKERLEELRKKIEKDPNDFATKRSILSLYRYLPSPENEEQVELMNEICDLFKIINEGCCGGGSGDVAGMIALEKPRRKKKPKKRKPVNRLK
jgi:hypothetical protein